MYTTQTSTNKEGYIMTKAEKFDKLRDEVEEFIANHQNSNPHYLFDDDIIKAFSNSKTKHIKKAIKEVR